MDDGTKWALQLLLTTANGDSGGAGRNRNAVPTPMERKVALSLDGCNNVRGSYVLQHGYCNIVLKRVLGVYEANSDQPRPRCSNPRYWNGCHNHENTRMKVGVVCNGHINPLCIGD